MVPITSDDLQRIFKNLDKNNLGQVSIEEIHHLLERIGIHSTLQELENLVGKQSLDWLEFLFFYDATVKPKITENDNAGDDLLEAFKVFDLNGDGFISSDELKSVLLKMGLLEKQSREDCREMICVFDKNADGVLDFDEFKDMMSVTPDSEI